MPFDEPKNYIAALIGLLLSCLGLIPILNMVGVLSWGIPEGIMLVITSFALYIITIAGIYLLVDSFMEDHGLRMISIVVALVVIILGLVPLLNSFGLIGFTIPLFGTPILYYVIFLIEGVFLMIAAFTML